MAWYVFPTMVAVDATGSVLRSGSGQIFAEDDLAGSTPLAVQDLGGNPLTQVTINDLGLTQAFQVEAPEVVWRSGGYAVPLSSPKGLREAAEASQVAAEAAQSAAEAAAEGVLVSDTVSAILSLTRAEYDALETPDPTILYLVKES